MPRSAGLSGQLEQGHLDLIDAPAPAHEAPKRPERPGAGEPAGAGRRPEDDTTAKVPGQLAFWPSPGRPRPPQSHPSGANVPQLDLEGPASHIAIATFALLVLTAAAGLLCSHVKLGFHSSFLPTYLSGVFLVSLLASCLLLVRFAVGGSLRFLCLGGTYLFSCVVIIVYFLVAPGALTTKGAVGADTTTAMWLWLLWHLGFVLFTGVTLLFPTPTVDRWEKSVDSHRRRVLAWVTPATLGLALASSTGIVLVRHHLPSLVQGQHYLPLAGTLVTLLQLLAVALLVASVLRGQWRQGAARWVGIALSATVVDLTLAASGTQEYTVPWYLARSTSLVAASAVLLGLLVEISHLYQNMAERNRNLQLQVARDPLTGMLSRTAILNLAGTLVTQPAARRRSFQISGDDPEDSVPRSGSTGALIMLDIDHFKRVNDQHGHLVGDEVLRAASARAAKALRAGDALGRFGGEEFLAILPGCDLPRAREVAERVREALRGEPIATTGGVLPITASLGVTALVPEDDVVAAIERADRALYASKEGGRDRVSVSAAATDLWRPEPPPG